MAQFILRIDGPDSQLEAMLVGHIWHCWSEEITIYIDPIAAKGGHLPDQDIKRLFVTGVPSILGNERARLQRWL
jgi:hypothetical protein